MGFRGSGQLKPGSQLLAEWWEEQKRQIAAADTSTALGKKVAEGRRKRSGKMSKQEVESVGGMTEAQINSLSPEEFARLIHGPEQGPGIGVLSPQAIAQKKIKKAAVKAPMKASAPAPKATPTPAAPRISTGGGPSEGAALQDATKKGMEGGAAGGVPGALVGAGVSILQSAMAAQQRGREKQAEAVASLGGIAQATAKQEQSALENLMSAWRAAILGA